MTDLATHRQKKVQAMSCKNLQMLEFCLLHGVEWDRLIVHRTHVCVVDKTESILARPDDTSSFVRANELPVRQ